MKPFVSFNFTEKKLNFSGHETFSFRYIWLPKAVRNVINFPDIFFRDDAIVILGVGKNMVRSIKYWCERLDLIEPKGNGKHQVSDLGEKLFGLNGWDPYLENPATLWILHWNLCKDIEKGPTWYLGFSRWGAPSFTKEQFFQWIEHIFENSPSKRLSANTIKRDIDVFVRTYVQSDQKLRLKQDSCDFPLVELGLINEIDSNVFEFTRGRRESLPNDIFSFALIDYWNNNFPSQNSLSFENILYGPGSPGRIFGLNENNLFERLQEVPNWTNISFDSTAGMRNIFRNHINEFSLIDSLNNYYKKGVDGIKI